MIFGRRRAVSETIGTLLLLSITVIGAVMLSNFVSEGFFQGVDQNPSTVEASADSIRLTGFDTRDSDELINVFSLDNKHDNLLCAKSNTVECINVVADKDKIPKDDGTDFIALKLRNANPDSVYLRNIQINNILHEWDDGTAGKQFDATVSGFAGDKYPKAGFFSIIPSPEKQIANKQFASQEVLGDEEVRVIIKLSENLSDIKMWDAMLIVVNFGGSQPAQFIVSSGDAKW